MRIKGGRELPDQLAQHHGAGTSFRAPLTEARLGAAALAEHVHRGRSTWECLFESWLLKPNPLEYVASLSKKQQWPCSMVLPCTTRRPLDPLGPVCLSPAEHPHVPYSSCTGRPPGTCSPAPHLL